MLLLSTYARGAWGAMLVGLLVIGLLQDRRIIIVLLVGLVAIMITVPSVATRLADLGGGGETVPGVVDPNSLAWRIGYWNEVLPYTAQTPISGIGLGMVLQQGKAAIGFVVVIGMALQVDQQPV